MAEPLGGGLRARMNEQRKDVRRNSGNEADFVSVVINFLNAALFIEEAIDSVYAQSHQAWELLLVDDGSTDASSQIAKHRAALDPERIRYLEHPGHQNRGTSVARNLGIAEARGELIAFLDADDVWLPQHLTRSVQLLNANPSADMVYGETEYWFSWREPAGSLPGRIQPHGFRADRIVRGPELLVRYLTHRAAVPTPTSITVRSRAVRASGGFVDSFPGMHDDQAFLARFCLHHDVYVSHENWDRYRQHDSSLCASAARRGEVIESQRAYLAWLRECLAEQGMRGTRIWEALQYAERQQRIQGHGWHRMVLRRALRAIEGVKIAMRYGL